MSGDERAAIEAEFDASMARAGVAVPPERRAGAVETYADLRRHAALVRQEHPPESEPATVYDLAALARSGPARDGDAPP